MNKDFECKKLYAMLYKKGLDRFRVKGMVKILYRMVGEYSLDACSVEQVQIFQDFINDMTTGQFDNLDKLKILIEI